MMRLSRRADGPQPLQSDKTTDSDDFDGGRIYAEAHVEQLPDGND